MFLLLKMVDLCFVSVFFIFTYFSRKTRNRRKIIKKGTYSSVSRRAGWGNQPLLNSLVMFFFTKDYLIRVRFYHTHFVRARFNFSKANSAPYQNLSCVQLRGMFFDGYMSSQKFNKGCFSKLKFCAALRCLQI